MKVAIISDSHDNVPNIDKMLAYCKKEKIKTILHCGDVCAAAVVKYIGENFDGDFYFIMGNVRGEPEIMKSKAEEVGAHFLGEESELMIDNKKIYLIHYPDKAREMAEIQAYDFVFYGHNHKPWEENIGKTKMLNPGTLAGLFQKATFAVWETETGNFELKILELMT